MKKCKIILSISGRRRLQKTFRPRQNSPKTIEKVSSRYYNKYIQEAFRWEASF